MTKHGDGRAWWPEFLPGSRKVVFNVLPRRGRSYDSPGEGQETQVAVYDLDTGEQRVLFEGDQARYASSGHIVYGRDESLWAVPFDAERLEVRGERRAVVEDVFTKVPDAVDFALSRNGVLAYIPGRSGAGDKRRLVWVNREGLASDLGFEEGRYFDAVVSPDGAKVAANIDRNIWVYDVKRRTRIKLVPDDGVHPVWTADGRRVVFEVPGSGLYWTNADGSGEVESLLESDALTRPGSWSPDGSHFAYTQAGVAGLDIWMLSRGEEPVTFLHTRFNEGGPMFSPDGRWLAYTSDETGIREVYIVPFPGPGGKIPVSVGGGRAPVWSPVGNELFFRDQEGRTFAAPLDSGTTLRVGQPELLFETLYYSVPAGDAHYDVSRDGTQFLMIDESTEDGMGLVTAAYQRSSGTSTSSMVVVLNWFEELKRLVPSN